MSEQIEDNLEVNLEDNNPFIITQVIIPSEEESSESTTKMESELISDLLNKTTILEQDIQNLKTQNNKRFSLVRILEPNEFRMSFLMWFLVNPFSLIFIPFLLGILIQFLIVQPTKERFTLTNPTNWTIPLIGSTLGFLAIGNSKVYDALQTKGDLMLLERLQQKLDYELEKTKNENKVQRLEDQRRYEAQRAEDQRKAEALRAEDQRRYDDLLKAYGKNLNELNHFKSQQEVKDS